ncbi:hypothetical protein [Enterococcus mundtii]|uniref:Uncharacterized protein n=1 Tax=Enterococcus mundtii TaxID=53346 RepID=A0ABQ0VFA7_ENTMU|nr:hypothetical protein [Enterococcus mundtii]GEN18357.1 hypothetical protein LAC02_16380 [Ligilactobacillus acidipiscis]MZZ59045.1 hypothetical protein [Enterococcus mundtii]MZZ61976.1 hypothetical protein [Enterococcus mundtii]MZZ68879.1 hypothetical protein [Enterococcus mundtii]MZZ97909.1 hypothetical protein [Enterococcus mundtii]
MNQKVPNIFERYGGNLSLKDTRKAEILSKNLDRNILILEKSIDHLLRGEAFWE